jgi:hypothetical protein
VQGIENVISSEVSTLILITRYHLSPISGGIPPWPLPILAVLAGIPYLNDENFVKILGNRYIPRGVGTLSLALLRMNRQ